MQLTHESTRETGVPSTCGFSVLPRSGEAGFWGFKKPGAFEKYIKGKEPRAIHIYGLDGGELRKLRGIKASCQH